MVPEKSTIGQVRTLHAQLQSVHGVVFESQHVYSALAYTTCFVFDEPTRHTRASARTAHEEAFDCEWKGDLCFFVEMILLLEAESKSGRLVKGRRRRKADVVWHRGLWLGRAEQIDGHVVGRNLVSS